MGKKYAAGLKPPRGIRARLWLWERLKGLLAEMECAGKCASWVRAKTSQAYGDLGEWILEQTTKREE